MSKYDSYPVLAIKNLLENLLPQGVEFIQLVVLC